MNALRNSRTLLGRDFSVNGDSRVPDLFSQGSVFHHLLPSQKVELSLRYKAQKCPFIDQKVRIKSFCLVKLLKKPILPNLTTNKQFCGIIIKKSRVI